MYMCMVHRWASAAAAVQLAGCTDVNTGGRGKWQLAGPQRT